MSGNSVLNVRAVTTAIAALNVAGVSITDLDGIPAQVFPRQCPILFPDPESFFGTAMAEEGALVDFWLATRQFNYRLLYAAVGQDREPGVHYVGFAAVVDALLTALMRLDVDNVDVLRVTVSQFGVVTDASKQSFMGCVLGVVLQEKIQGA